MKIFLFVLLLLVFVPFIVILFGAFLPSRVLNSYEQALGKLPEPQKDDDTIKTTDDRE